MDTETESTRRELAKYPKRKASRSNDPRWKYAYYPMPEVNKDVVKCILCGNSNHEGINQFKQHLIGGYPDICKCPKITKEIAKEMTEFVQNKKKRSKKNVQIVEEDNDDDEVQSYEVMVESIGQYGPGLKPPTYHELRVPLLKKAKEETEKLKEKHEKALKRYGCTLMSDGWTDRRGRSLVNFLANSPEGTFFLGSVNASSESNDAQMLANLLESKIKEIGEKNVVQVVTDNGANYKLAGQILEIRMPTLFWTPCAAHCVDLMLEDIGKIPAFKKTINQARRCTTFIYRHGRVLDAMREKTNGRDLIRTAATRFATAFLTLDSLQKKKNRNHCISCFVGRIGPCQSYQNQKMEGKFVTLFSRPSFGVMLEIV
ncbi:uncharacterized protein LOC141715134 [Apium graveolens]|uniref:uncharacterized protein LOC141715134 n=1 Tax=Apium graveolens TaxID=4045 RepID=UPI003D78E0AC